MKLDRFYPIFPDAGWIERMLPHGLRLAQLRVKGAAETDLRAEIARARDLCKAAGAVLVVNDHWRAAIDLGCDWVHLGQEDLDEADVDAIRRRGLRLGVSTHSDAELDRALGLAPDYVALGPVYPTILKQMRWRPQGLDRLGAWKRRIGDVPLVAIGGMSVERAAGVLAAGADIVSVVTDITLHREPETRLREWVEATR